MSRQGNALYSKNLRNINIRETWLGETNLKKKGCAGQSQSCPDFLCALLLGNMVYSHDGELTKLLLLLL